MIWASKEKVRLVQEHLRLQKKKEQKEIAFSCQQLIDSILLSRLIHRWEFLIPRGKHKLMIQANSETMRWSKAPRAKQKQVTSASTISRIQEPNGLRKEEQVIMRCFLGRILALIKLHQDLTIIKSFMVKVWSLMSQDLVNIHKARGATSRTQASQRTDWGLWTRWDQVPSNSLEAMATWMPSQQSPQEQEEAPSSIPRREDSKRKDCRPIIIRKEPSQMLDQDLMSI